MEQHYYLFDFDGVLVDSMPFWAGIHIQTLQQASIPVPADFVQTITPLGNENASRYTLSLGVDLPLEQYLARVSQTLYTGYTTKIALKPYVADTLARLKADGLHLNVLTASPHLYVDPCLQRHGIYHLFENIWTIEDFGLTKAQPEIYRAAATRLGAAPALCTLLDDNLTAVQTACTAGLQTIGVYDALSAENEAALRRTAGRYIRDFSQL